MLGKILFSHTNNMMGILVPSLFLLKNDPNRERAKKVPACSKKNDL